MHCHIINLQEHLGGAEVYTLFFTRALLANGCTVTLFVHRNATWHSGLGGAQFPTPLLKPLPTPLPTPPPTQHPNLQVHAVASDLEIPALLPARSWILTHGPVSIRFAAAVKHKHLLTGFCHMPLAGRRAGVLADYDLVFGVSDYVISTLQPVGVSQIYPEAFLGVADFARFAPDAADTFAQGSVYSWDKRKVRDRVLSWGAPLWRALDPPKVFARRAGFTLGIVSNIGPIKQFDVLFRQIAPIIAARPEVSLEIFGNGAYRSVADLKHALRPLGDRARFWGRQANTQPLYAQFDYLLSGLPEKEALGLNIIESQTLGTPVLAVNAPPFTETVSDGATGFLFTDPRTDQGVDFARVLDRAIAGPRLAPLEATAHLARFSTAAFASRIDRLVRYIHQRQQGASS